MSKKRKLKELNTRNINKNLIRKELLNNHLKSDNKALRYELKENLENFKKHATRLQKCIADNGTLKKLYYYKVRTGKLEADKVKKNRIWSFTATEIRKFKAVKFFEN